MSRHGTESVLQLTLSRHKISIATQGHHASVATKESLSRPQLLSLNPNPSRHSIPYRDTRPTRLYCDSGVSIVTQLSQLAWEPCRDTTSLSQHNCSCSRRSMSRHNGPCRNMESSNSVATESFCPAPRTRSQVRWLCRARCYAAASLSCVHERSLTRSSSHVRSVATRNPSRNRKPGNGQ